MDQNKKGKSVLDSLAGGMWYCDGPGTGTRQGTFAAVEDDAFKKKA